MSNKIPVGVRGATEAVGQGIPERLGRMTVKACEPGLDCRLVFSGLDASVAGEVA